MNKRTDYYRTRTSIITVEVAKCALVRLLRPYLRHSSTSFVGVLIVPPGDHIWSYRDAVEEPLSEPVTLDEHGDDGIFVQGFEDLNNANILSVLNGIRAKRRTVLLFAEREGIPRKVPLAAAFIEDLDAPEPVHFKVAAKRCGFGEISTADAEFLALRPFDEIRLATTRGPTARQRHPPPEEFSA